MFALTDGSNFDIINIEREVVFINKCPALDIGHLHFCASYFFWFLIVASVVL
mgnify:CR=1 FL=1